MVICLVSSWQPAVTEMNMRGSDREAKRRQEAGEYRQQ